MYRKLIFTLALAAGTLLPAAAQQQKELYQFHHPMIIQGIDPYTTTVNAFGNNIVTVMTGAPTAEARAAIRSLKQSPTGVFYGVVGGHGKKAFLQIFRNNQAPNMPAQYRHNNKKFGRPLALAFSPDGRGMYVATDRNKIEIFGAQGKFPHLDSIPAVAPVNMMTTSSNGYYLATADSLGVVVYNIEQRKPRTTFSYESRVVDIAFNTDANEFAVLTADGVVRLYDTRTFLIKSSIDDLGYATDFAYNIDGKYLAVITSASDIAVVNLLDTDDRQHIMVEGNMLTDVVFIPDSRNNTLLVFSSAKELYAKRMSAMQPFFNKLVSSEADALMDQWLKMREGETMDEYKLRVNDETRAAQRRLFEDEIATGFASNLVEMASVSLGQYDARHELQEVTFDNMPPIYLPVSTDDKKNFTDASTLEFRNAKYGIMPNDKFEMIYADVYNTADGKTYTFDNINRRPLAFMVDDEDPLTMEVVQQQQMEDLKLQEIKRQIVEEAKHNNIISDRTNISVDSKLETAYDAEGKKILNYKVNFAYEVETGFSAQEDFGPGKYHVEESGAASAMLNLVKTALEGDFAQYVAAGKKLRITLSGTADSSPIRGKIRYDGSYGNFEDEPVYQNDQLTTITVTEKTGITQNEQLAFLRAYGVKDNLQKNITKLNEMQTDYQYRISVAEGRGAEFRRITAEFTFIDVF